MQPLWAVARNTIKATFKNRTVLVLVVVMAVLAPMLPFQLKATEILAERMKLVITYTMALTTVFLAFLTMMLSATVLTDEISRKQIVLLDAKPISRWQILLGKFLGVVLVDAILLAVMLSISYVAFIRVAQQRARTPSERIELENTILTSRTRVSPGNEPNYMAMAQETAAQRIVEGSEVAKLDDEGLRQYVLGLARSLKAQYERLLAAGRQGASRQYVFENIPPPSRGLKTMTLYLRIDDNQQLYQKTAQLVVEAGVRGKTPMIATVHEVAPKTAYPIIVSTDQVHEGRLEVNVHNATNVPLIVTFSEGIKLLVPTGTFAGNLARVGALVLMQMMFLAAVGLFFSTFVSMPVALTDVLVVYLLMIVAGFVETLIGSLGSPTGPQTAGDYLSGIGDLMYRLLFALVPSISVYSPFDNLATGQAIPWSLLGWGALLIVLVRCGILMLAGSLIFARREIALAFEKS